MSNDHDEIELGTTGLVPMPDGWYKNVHTKETIAPDGRVFDQKGELVEDQEEE